MRVLAALLVTFAAQCQPSPPEMAPAVRESPPGLFGLPFAPPGLDDCEEMEFYRVQFGLPERFKAIGFRESRCLNTVISRTGCCVGRYQLHYVGWRDHRTAPRYEACEATWLNVRGADPLSMQRQACAAKALFDVAGFAPWRT